MRGRSTGLCGACRRGLLLVRGIFGFGAIGNYLWAVTLLPLNDTLVLTFTAPIWAAVLGPFLINEQASKCALRTPCSSKFPKALQPVSARIRI